MAKKNVRNMLLLLLLLCSVDVSAQKTVNPKVSFVTDKTVKVQSVEVTDTETILDVTSEGDWWSLDSLTQLIFPNVENQVCSLIVKRVESGGRFYKFNTQYEAPNRAIRVKIHFPRLPAGVDNINLSEPGGWGITGICIKTTTSAPVTAAATPKSEDTVSAQSGVSSAQGGATAPTASAKNTPSRVQAVSSTPRPQVVNYDFVDLGLPSKTLWANKNVGAIAPDQPGDYYAWGETKTKRVYDWSSYKFAQLDEKTWGIETRLIKYCTSPMEGKDDDKRELESIDDAATQNVGAAWRMPTEKQWEELCTRCTWKEETLSDNQKILRVTGPNGKSLVLPCVGYIDGDGNLRNYIGSLGAFYWSRTLNGTFPKNAVGMQDGGPNGTRLSFKRSWGFQVRAVYNGPRTHQGVKANNQVVKNKEEVANDETAFLDDMPQTNWAAKVDEARQLMYRPVPDYAKAITLLTEVADHGDTNAQWMLAQLYLEGKHTTRDISKAWNYAAASSSAGNPIGSFWLSVLYEHGEGVTMGAVERAQRADALFEEAKAALERMAKQGQASTNQDANALTVEQSIRKADLFETLGRMLEQEGKESDALDWYEKAADEGNRYAQKQMGDWMMTGSIDGILRLADKTADNKALKPQQDRMKTTEYYRKAANQGDVDAQNMLGILLVQQYRNQTTSYGRAFSKDLLTEAKANFQYAADQRNIDALYNLGYCYENGYGCTKDKNKAVLHYQMAAGSGHKKAEEHLTKMR